MRVGAASVNGDTYLACFMRCAPRLAQDRRRHRCCRVAFACIVLSHGCDLVAVLTVPNAHQLLQLFAPLSHVANRRTRFGIDRWECTGERVALSFHRCADQERMLNIRVFGLNVLSMFSRMRFESYALITTYRVWSPQR